MTLRTALFASAAFAAVTIGAGMAFAQSNTYNTNPTPQEQQQTKTLNTQADQNIAPKDASAVEVDTADQQKYQAQMLQYQAAQDKYWQSQEKYQQQRDHIAAQGRAFEVARDQFLADRIWYDAHHYRLYASYPQYPDQRLQQLYLIAEPSQQIAHAAVIDREGYEVGQVRNVETAPDGRLARVQIALNDEQFVWVSADELRFDPDQHALYSSMSGRKLWDLSISENS